MPEPMLPDNFTEIELGMSNCGQEIDGGFEEAITGKPTFGRHAGWNFNGTVFHKDKQFHEDVWCYCVFQKTISADTLMELMLEVNSNYGSG